MKKGNNRHRIGWGWFGEKAKAIWDTVWLNNWPPYRSLPEKLDWPEDLLANGQSVETPSRRIQIDININDMNVGSFELEGVTYEND